MDIKELIPLFSSLSIEDKYQSKCQTVFNNPFDFSKKELSNPFDFSKKELSTPFDSLRKEKFKPLFSNKNFTMVEKKNVIFLN